MEKQNKNPLMLRVTKKTITVNYYIRQTQGWIILLKTLLFIMYLDLRTKIWAFVLLELNAHFELLYLLCTETRVQDFKYLYLYLILNKVFELGHEMSQPCQEEVCYSLHENKTKQLIYNFS